VLLSSQNVNIGLIPIASRHQRISLVSFFTLYD